MAVSPQYSRRVSFNNLSPEEPVSTNLQHPYGLHLVQAAEAAVDFLKVFGNYTFSRKRVRLPDPPAHSILRNRLSPAQLSSNIEHALLEGTSFHGDLNDLAANPPKNVPRLELARVVDAVENGNATSADNLDGNAIDPNDDASYDTNDNATGVDNSQADTSAVGQNGESMANGDSASGSSASTNASRRKLYSGMTNEELMALDPQYAPARHSDLGSFKFDSPTTAPPPSRRMSAPAISIPRAKQVIYPSLNENNYRAVSLTSKHAEYDRVLEPRTLLTFLSGRKHTWNSLDWLLLSGHQVSQVQPFLVDGDHLVVAALVPLKFVQASDSRRAHSPEQHLCARCDHLLDYIVASLPSGLRVKVTVELVLDEAPEPMVKKPLVGTKYMLYHVFRQYQPTLVVVGNKSTNLNFRYPLRRSRPLQSQQQAQSNSKLTSVPALVPSLQPHEREPERYLCKLSSFLIRHSPVPVILVGNRTVFHRRLLHSPQIQVTFCDDGTQPSKSILDVPTNGSRKNSAVSDASIESFCGQDDVSSGSAETADSLARTVAALSTSLDPSRFQDMVAAISLALASELRHYLELVRERGVDALPRIVIESKAHQAFMEGATKERSRNRGSVYKVKSLISYNEEDEKKNVKMIKKKAQAQTQTPLQQKKRRSFLQKLHLKK